MLNILRIKKTGNLNSEKSLVIINCIRGSSLTVINVTSRIYSSDVLKRLRSLALLATEIMQVVYLLPFFLATAQYYV